MDVPVSVALKTQCPPCMMGKLTVRFCLSSMTPLAEGLQPGTRTLLSGVSPLGIWTDTTKLLVSVPTKACSSNVRIPPAGTVCKRVPCKMSAFDAVSLLLKIIGPIIFPSSYDGWVAIHVFRSAGDKTLFNAAKSLMSEVVAKRLRLRRCFLHNLPVTGSILIPFPNCAF